MAIGANSYGSAAGVGALVPRRSNASGTFDGDTNPTLTVLEGWIDRISAMINAVLAADGFDIPIDNTDAPDAVLIVSQFVEEEVAALVEGVNGSGRFGPTVKNKQITKSRFRMISDDIEDFIEKNKLGLERLGASRSSGLAESIGYKKTMNDGRSAFPIRTRQEHGNEFIDW